MTTPLFHATREADDLLVLEVQGSMDARAMEVALTLLVDEMEGLHHGACLMRAEGVAWPSLGAIGVEIRHWVQMMAMVEKLDKVAVLTDETWVRAIAAVESALIPNLVIRAFAPDQEERARAWLAEPLSQDATA
ncbi:hypothetical protein roselon_03482 [Roseibacterium elongatum DSM 19469]|uniref:STAS/SEC14 domain-containing protein n=1 Tax=Roseicyclus elongatus DSM 19469 TaxID=1294273 RepID=W8S663_9RHOB|nr:STAS/SEC14 domain-containing protein [Roseibacterium elongatum]AHM05737.1 hypothetical protein roselon_03482 [Roseibacterium elongatum DSM 19469]